MLLAVLHCDKQWPGTADTQQPVGLFAPPDRIGLRRPAELGFNLNNRVYLSVAALKMRKARFPV